jgi:hypothetical protein
MQKNATYNKIRDVLNRATEGTQGITDLALDIQETPGSFVYYRRDANGEVREHACKLSTVRRKIRFCIDLGLIEDEESCSLTRSGRDALDPDRFSLVLQQAVLGYLEKNDVHWSRIESAIRELDYPSPRRLYVEVSPPVSERRFRTCLFLLSQCGADIGQNLLEGHVMKLYLTEEEAERIRGA